jgi:outer membrane protein
MKNGLLVWNVLLTLIAGYLLFTQFSKKKDSGAAQSKHSVKNSDTIQQPFRIAYFEMDSVQANALMVKDVQSDIEKKERDYNSQLLPYENNYRNKLMEYQQKEKAGAMQPVDYEKAQVVLRELEGKLNDKRKELDQQYQEFVMRSQLKLKKDIEEFVADYNKDKQYSYIVSYEQGLFYYKDTLYNITQDLVKGLNEKYKKNKKD